MIGIILVFHDEVAQVDYDSLLKTISKTNDFHFCIVTNKNTIMMKSSLKEIEKVTDKVSIINVKRYCNKLIILKSAFRYLRDHMNLDDVGYFEFNGKKDNELFSNVMRTFNTDNDLLLKIKSIKTHQRLKRMMNKKVFSIIDLFNTFYKFN